jgi:hypothetical protein
MAKITLGLSFHLHASSAGDEHGRLTEACPNQCGHWVRTLVVPRPAPKVHSSEWELGMVADALRAGFIVLACSAPAGDAVGEAAFLRLVVCDHRTGSAGGTRSAQSDPVS